nr:retrovirus-related Pol polyprotein from transposon TNT 1-94 [Tanacetum cinerariifolium]
YNSHTDSKLKKDYKTEYKKMKAKLALFEASSSSPQNPKTFQPKNKSLVAEILIGMKKRSLRMKKLLRLRIPYSTTYPEKPLGSFSKLKDNSIDLSTLLSKRETRLRDSKDKSSKSVDSSRMSQDSKPKVQNTGSSKSLRPKPIQKPQLKYELCPYTNHSTNDCYRILYCMIFKKEDHRTSNHEMYIASLKRSENYKAQPYQYASSSKHILKANAKPFPPCTHYGFNDHKPDAYRNYLECEICRGKHHRASSKLNKTSPSGSVASSSYGLVWSCKPNVQNHEKYTLVIVDEYLRKRILDIIYFYVFGCPVFIHNHKDHLGKFNAKADNGYFLGYSSVSKAFRVYNTRRQQIEETYHVTFDESMEAIRFTNTSVNEIGIDDSSRYPPDEFLY